MMLTMLVGLFAFQGMAQNFVSSTPPATPWYAGQEATVTYEAENFDAGTSFIVWDDADGNTQIDEGEEIFGMSDVQDAEEDINFEWSESRNGVSLKLAAFSGSQVTGDVIPFKRQDVTVIGSNSIGDNIYFDRASSRSLTTNAIDLDTSEPVVLSFFYQAIFGSNPDTDNPIEVLYSTNGFSTAGTVLEEDVLEVDEFEGINQTLSFTLPAGAKSATTSFRIRQKGTVDYGTGKNWQVVTGTNPLFGVINVEIGETYNRLLTSTVNEFQNINAPQLVINNFENADGDLNGTIYPGDEITVNAELQNADLTDLEFAVTVTSNSGERYLLENQDITVDNGTKEITAVGDIPTNIVYDNLNGWDIDIYAYEGSQIQFGVSESYNFSNNLPADFELEGGSPDFAGLTFDEAGERSVTTVPYNISSTDGTLIFTAARADNVLSPEGTDIIVEYSTDGESYTELTSIALNSLSTGGTKDTLDAWPSGVVSNSTQFRFRQEGNNGADLDAFILEDLDIQSNTNLISENFIDRGFASVLSTLLAPVITLDNINIGGDGQAFPMEEYDLTYTIDNGSFPTNTPAKAYLQRTGQPDIIIGETDNVSGESIDITVPPIEAGDYNIYFRTLNEEEYGNVNLAIYDLGLDITSIEYDDPVVVAEDEFTYAGSAITVNYSIQGSAGSGAELMMSVYDFNPDVDDWVMIGSTTTLDGNITATLPTGINYGNNPEVQLSLGSGGVYTSDFDEEFFNEYFWNDPFPGELVESSQGTNDGIRPDLFNGSGVRSATSVPIDLSYGGSLSLDFYTESFSSDFDVRLEGSSDGNNWEQLDEFTHTADDQIQTFSVDVPNELWSENFQFRIIYNEDEAFGFNENTTKFYQAIIDRPAFLEVVQDDAPFNLIRPSLAVNDYDKTAFAMGEEVSINYNAVGFPAATDYAAVVEQGGEYVVVGTASDEGAGTINATMPIGFGDAGLNYDISIVPFEGDEYKQGETIDVDQEEDYLVVSGNSGNDFNQFNFDQTGDRELLTRAFDLSDVSSATLNFDFNNSAFGSFDANANKNTVPRLESSVDGGATFQIVEVYELEDGEEQIYDDGLLYLGQGYSIEIPAELLTEATHFRWSQPLNLGEAENEWRVENISITLNDDNRVPDFIFTDNVNGNNPETINITAPDLNGYTWMQANLDDAVFNGESFEYSWDLVEGFNSEDVDAFPDGTTFTFYLEEGGDYVIDPNTELPYVLGITTSLGTFEAEVPFFVVNGNYNVRMSASIEIEGEDGAEDYYYFYGDEETGEDVGELDVFLRVAELVYQGDENATIYAGQDVTFGIDFENNETNTAGVEELYANLILNTNEGNLVLATQQGMDDITVALPTDVTGTRNFSLEITENAPIGEVGSILENSDYSNLQLTSSNFIAGDASAFEVVTSTYQEADNVVTPWIIFDYEFNQVGNQQLRLEYSIDGGAWTLNNNLSPFGNNLTTPLPFVMRDGNGNNNIRYRLRLSGDEAIGSSFSVNNLRIDRDAFNGNNFIPNLTETGGIATFDGNSGRRLITTRDFTSEEIADATLLTFEASFDQLPANLTASQYVNFEYSTDGGATYTALETYPEEDAMMTLSNESFTYPVTADMKENGVRFRWRQEEAKGDFSVDNINMVFGEVLPFDYINNSQTISSQALIIDAVSATEGCLDADVTLDYTIRGRFGADNIVTVDYSNVNDLMNPSLIDGYEFNVTEGSGQVTFAFAGNTLSQFDDNANYKFRLSANDETTDNTVNVDGAYSETNYELVAPLNTDATFTVINDPLSCSPEDVMISIDATSMQDYFLYEILDGEGTVLGSLERDPEEPENEINIGEITASTDLELRITSQSSTGSVCNTLVVDEEEVEVLADFQLYSYANPDENYKLVSEGAELSTCQSAGQIELRVYRPLANGVLSGTGASLVEWFRDDLNNPITTGNVIFDNEMEVSGAYFARVTTGSCVYTTESIQINVEQAPDQPTITVVSGDLAACSSAEPVVLEAPEGFAYYSWNSGETSRSITVEESGTYNVQVSNLPFGIGCASPTSASVSVDRYETPEVSLRLGTSPGSTLIADGSTLDVCDSDVIYFFEDNSYGNSGIIEVIKDGDSFETLEGNNYVINESGTYSFVWSFDGINVSGCTAASVEFTMNVFEAPTTAPVLTSTGDLDFCEGQGTVTLEAPAGFEYYNWFRNGGSINTPNNGFANSNVIEVSTSGIYTVEVANLNGCESPESNEVVVNVIDEPSLPGLSQVNTTCGDGAVEFSLFNGNGSAMTYQLYNGETGQTSGTPVTIQSGQNGSLFTDVLTETGIPFYVEVMYADGTGCSNVNPSATVNANVRTISLEVEGASLVANYATAGVSEVRWFRDGVKINSATGNSSLTITDAAEYTVEVEYESGCVLTASSADIAGKVLANREGMDMQVTSYPNPTQSDVTLNVNSQYMGKHEVIVTSMTGQIMMQSSFEKSSFDAEHAMNVANLEEGIYNVQIRHDGLTQNVRIIKK